ncbi:E3 ubiquitin-protein ligase TRIM56-like isoform X2 [Portunus trituberculatus]|uniref:E3 ubiquitin-protein ligase TRIM56-like isoform X2 n=1 Tax=Portunus trituberculatus TaxID=210409 RepID=UPI001E1CE567|nr:E3 ubiquitin-protein ligase TRIM56-like isoform X2 [Portunus trituberculatus]
MDDNVEDCPVCLITFDDTLRRPRTLPCGHTHCTPCINELEEEQEVITCPTCRTSHALPETGQFPISYITEAFIKKMRGLASVPLKAGKELTALAPVTQPAPRPTAGLSRKTQSLLQDQEAKILAAIRSCQEEQRQLADYLTTLGGWGGRQQRLEDELQTLMDQSKGAREVISREESRVEGRKEKVRQREEALHAALETLLTPATRQEAYEVIENADQLLVEVEEEEEEEREAVIPDVHVVTTVARMANSSRAVLQAATSAATQTAMEAAVTTPAAAMDSTLLAPFAAAAERLAPPLKAEELLRLTQRARGLVKAGLILAVQDVEGQTRHARISLQHGRLHLHSLQAPPPPPHALILQMGEVMPASPPCEAFLDLAWPGSAARRVVFQPLH